MTRRRAFAVGAHPDDVEFFMAGTLIRLGEAGWEIHCMALSKGACSGYTGRDVEMAIMVRQEEARRAAETIGAVFHPGLVHDLEILYEKATLMKLGSIVRDIAPEIVLTHSVTDYMIDHENACKLAVTAAFARTAAYFPVDPPMEPLKRDVAVYHAQPYTNRDSFSRIVTPDIYVDITSVLDQKTAMLAEHKSQTAGVTDETGMDRFLADMRRMHRELGEMSGRYEFAEGWRRRNPAGFGMEGVDPLLDALKGSAFVLARERPEHGIDKGKQAEV